MLAPLNYGTETGRSRALVVIDRQCLVITALEYGTYRSQFASGKTVTRIR